MTSRLVQERPDDDVRAELESFVALLFGVLVNVGVGPTVAWVRLKCVEHSESLAAEQAEALWWLVVVLVCLWKSVRELIVRLVDAVREWQLLEFLLGEYFLHLTADRLVHAVIIVNVDEAACIEIRAQALCFALRHLHVAVTCQEEERVIVDVIAREIDPEVLGIDVDIRILTNEAEEVRLR